LTAPRASRQARSGACKRNLESAGGAVELGEKVIDALKREIREEVGIEIEVGA